MSVPADTITFLFTDIEGSTRLWEQHPEAMRHALARHDALAAAEIARHGGHLVKTRGEGDSLFATFERAGDAMAAACALQIVFHEERWPDETPILARMALHTGTAEHREGDYYGPDVNRCARLRAVAHGGQTLLSSTTTEMAGDALPAQTGLRDLGSHRLKDLALPEHVFQLFHPSLTNDFPPLKSLSALPNNLPHQLTSFIGRVQEMAQIRQNLSQFRLLTLTGAGGSGKTRLAMQVAEELLAEYVDGVWLVELAPLSDPTLVPSAAASVLGVREESGHPLVATLTDFLRAKSALLVFDNCEHLIGACARLADGLLRACGRLRILATSREALGITGETTYRVPSLTLPDIGHLSPERPDFAARMQQYEAVQLFVERATRTHPGFVVTSHNAAALLNVCRRLDGIPLALELAAARVNVLPIQQIADRLDDRFRLLTGGSRTALPRQQTLRALIDWSYDLLTEQERTLLRRLSVFAGSWTLEAAEAVCADDGVDEWEVLDLLSRLMDRSLVQVDETSGTLRYRMQETLRQYGQDRLHETGEQERLGLRHQQFFLRFAELAEPNLFGGGRQSEWFARLEIEHDNFRAALRGCESESGLTETGLRLAGALWWFWMVRSYFTEAHKWLEGALASVQDAHGAGRAKVLYGAGFILTFQGEYGRAAQFADEALALNRALGDAQGVGFSLFTRLLVAFLSGDAERTPALAEESLAFAQSIHHPWLIAGSSGVLGLSAYQQGDYEQAVTLLDRCLNMTRAMGEQWLLAASLIYLGHVMQAKGDSARATELEREGLVLSATLGDKRRVAHSLRRFAGIWRAQDKPARAARLLGAAESVREAVGAVIPTAEQADYDKNMEATRQALGTDSFTAIWSEGRAMTLEQAMSYALTDDDSLS